MKLPVLEHILKDEEEAHLTILLLVAANSLLIVLLFFIIFPQTRGIIPKVIPISSQTPIVDFNLVSPQANSTVSGTVPLITTLSNGPKILGARLMIDDAEVQALSSQKTEKLTLFWDTTKHIDGLHVIEIKVVQDNNLTSSISTLLKIQNNVSREISQR